MADETRYSAEMRRFFDRFIAEAAPNIRRSSHFLLVAPDEPDPKVALELGYAILTGKPLVVVVPKGRLTAGMEKLLRVADHIVADVDMDTDAGKLDAHERIRRVLHQ